jgi:hypothetical protein
MEPNRQSGRACDVTAGYLRLMEVISCRYGCHSCPSQANVHARLATYGVAHVDEHIRGFSPGRPGTVAAGILGATGRYAFHSGLAGGAHHDRRSMLATSAEISAALGVYAEVPSERDLGEQALAIGGETVLAAMLANALVGAAIGLGILAEGRMLESGVESGERLSLARAQALRASGAEGPGFVGVLHWQAAQLAWPLRALKDAEQAPLGRALAACSWALVSRGRASGSPGRSISRGLVRFSPQTGRPLNALLRAQMGAGDDELACDRTTMTDVEL